MEFSKKFLKKISSRSQALPTFFSFVLSTFFWGFFISQPRCQIGTIDSYLYTALSLNYLDSVERFGSTYYATRIAAILPQKLFYQWLGIEWGFLCLRITLSTITAFSTFKIIEKVLSVRWAYLLTPVLCFNPWFIRSLAWDYVDGFGVVCMLVVISLTLCTASTLGPLVAGWFSGMAASANIAFFAYLFAFYAAWKIGTFSKDKIFFEPKKFFLFISGLLGFFFITNLCMRMWSPLEIIPSKLIEYQTALNLIKGETRAFWKPWSFYLQAWNFYTITPFLILSLQIFSLSKASPKKSLSEPFMRVAFSYLAFVCFGILLQHFIIQSAVLKPTRFSYSIPACILAALSLLKNEKAEKHKISIKAFFLCQGWLLLILFLQKYESLTKTVSLFNWLFLMSCILLYIARVWKTQALMGILILTFCLCIFQRENPKSNFFARPFLNLEKSPESSYLQIARKVNAFLLTEVPKNKKFRIWYETPPSQILRTISAFHFWQYSMLNIGKESNFPFPSSQEAKAAKACDYIVVITEKRHDLMPNAQQALMKTTGKKWILSRQQNLMNSDSDVRIAILRDSAN